MKAIQVLCLVSCLAGAAVASPVKNTPAGSQCGAQKDLFDSNGNYLKTACILYSGQTQDSACSEVNMNLFVIDSNESKQGVLRFATSIFGSGGGSTLWINGKRENDGDWYKKDSSEYPMWSELAKVLDDDEESQDESNMETMVAVMPEEKCLILSAFGPFKVDTSSCGKSMYPICEYTKTENVPQQSTTTTEATTEEQGSTEDTKEDDSYYDTSFESERDPERDAFNQIDDNYDDDYESLKFDSGLYSFRTGFDNNNVDEGKWWKWIKA
jgi:hypothetical protein